eukprot:5903587-Ditylum_brightwellii.AAC.1
MQHKSKMKMVLHELHFTVPCERSSTALTTISAPPTTQRFGFATTAIAQREGLGPGPWHCHA